MIAQEVLDEMWEKAVASLPKNPPPKNHRKPK